ncbi:MAG TPA: zinc-dependent alcohol dehydrogenase [Longimicrobiales bacterium]|nr:zinc-dependent alcohol dehydrogenase [Longimicrobiales bacterium]
MVYHGPGDVRYESKPDPEILHENDIVLRVTRTAICGSDVHLYHGFVPDTRVGHTFGHEFTGVVEELGPAVRNLTVGDRVVVPFNISCGVCFYCSRDLYGMCENSNPNSEIASGVFGYSHTAGGYDGGQAQYVRVPFADVGPMKIPEDMDDEQVLLLSDVLPTGYQAAEMGGIREGDTVVVFGCGPVGLLAQKSAQLMGARRVIAVDRLPYRLEFARAYNGVETVDFRDHDDPVAHLKELCDGRGPDVAIDAVGLEADGSFLHGLLGRRLKLEAGAATVVDWAIHTVRKGGTVVLIGVYGPPWNLVPIGTAMNKGLTLRMAQCNTRRYMPHLLEHIRAGRIDAAALISHRMGLSEVAAAYGIFSERLDDCRKVVLDPAA